MIKRILRTLLLSAIISGTLFAHSGKPKFHVIVDTDGALDDMRSISMLLAGNDIRVLAITCSQGTLLPDSVFQKVKSLLSVYHHEGIPIGKGEELNQELPVWTSFAQHIVWGTSTGYTEKSNDTNSLEILNRTVADYHDKIILIALGSLKTYADWLSTNPLLISKIDRIVWYNDLSVESGFNYKVSPGSFEIIEQTGIPLEIIANGSDKFLINNDYLQNIGNAKSIYAKQIGLVHKQPEIAERIKQKHLQLWDDLVPLYLTVPLFFQIETKGNIRYILCSQTFSACEFVHMTTD